MASVSAAVSTNNLLSSSPRTLRIVSYNVNSLRTLPTRLRYSLSDFLHKHYVDILAIQEHKLSSFADLARDMALVNGYHSYFTFAATKKGYSGVATYVRDTVPVRSVSDSYGDADFANEGRIMVTDHVSFVLINVYVPNGGMSDERLQYKLRFYKSFHHHVTQLVASGRSVIIVGDINTAHTELDVHSPQRKVRSTGFLPIERRWLDAFIAPSSIKQTELPQTEPISTADDDEVTVTEDDDSKVEVPVSVVNNAEPMASSERAPFIDSFRHFHPGLRDYTFYDMRTQAREANKGWRIDYALITHSLLPHTISSEIIKDVVASDHIPIVLTLSIVLPNAPIASADIPSALSASTQSQYKQNRPITSFFKRNVTALTSTSTIATTTDDDIIENVKKKNKIHLENTPQQIPHGT